ncbi:MAG: YigZ family protein [Oscillospiraceae bacterium]
MSESYRTISQTAEDFLEEKKSKFIARIAPVRTEEEAVGFINSVKAANRKARHNVYAYILREGNISRYSDDGEPQGTGGVPVLEVIKKEGLTDVCVVVTRYFGGILLGTGGLARAYSGACKLAVESADIMEMHSCSKITLRCDYTFYGRISQLLPQFEVKTISEDFAEAVSLTTLVKSELADKFKEKLINAANGKIDIEEVTNLTENFA